jgi:hypothetical protein
VNDQVQVEPGAVDVAAEQPTLVGLADRRGQAPAGEATLAPQVDERLMAADRVGRHDGALDQGVRVALEQLHVLERARLALVGVDHQVGRLAGPLGQEPPLHAGGEASPAAPAQARVLDHLHELSRVLGEGSVQAGVPVQLQEPIHVVRPPVAPAAAQHAHGPRCVRLGVAYCLHPTFHFRLHLRGRSCRVPRAKARYGRPTPEEHLLGGPPAYCVRTAQPGHGDGAIGQRPRPRVFRSSVSLPIGAPGRCYLSIC